MRTQHARTPTKPRPHLATDDYLHEYNQRWRSVLKVLRESHVLSYLVRLTQATCPKRELARLSPNFEGTFPPLHVSGRIVA